MPSRGSAPAPHREAATQFTVVFGLLLILGAWAGAILLSRLDRRNEVERGRSENAFMALAFEEQARRVIKTADTALLYLKEEFEKTGEISTGMQNFGRMTKEDLQAVQIAIADAAGNLLYSAVPLKAPLNVFEREHFQAQLRREDAGLYIAKPVKSKATGAWTFFLSRRIDRPDGTFGGIVSVGLDPFHFGRIFGGRMIEQGRTGILVGSDHIVRIRISPTTRLIGDDISGYSPVFTEAARSPVGHYEVVPVLDNLPRMAGYRVMPDYPLIVIVSALTSDVLADWKKRNRLNTLGALLFTLFVVGFCALLIRAQQTARKNAEETRSLQERLLHSQKLEAIGTLAGGVAHDFNNMLGVIIGRTELAMMQADPSSRLYGNLEEISKAALRSAEVTRQLLAFARKQTVAPRVLDLNESLEAVLQMIRRLIGENIELSWKPGRDLRRVRIDPSQLDQMLANLVTNARDAITGAGRVTIETSSATPDESYCTEHPGAVPGRPYVVLSVTDDGHGIERDKLDSIFDPFFTTKEQGKGTGLGLATVYGIVQQNGGFITVYSEPGQGATFRVYLPGVEAKTGEAAEERGPQEPRGGTETILIVEDEAASLSLAQTMLESFGYRVLAAGSPFAAIQLAESGDQTIELLITDVVMPGMNGRQVHDVLAGKRPGLKTLFMSGYPAEVIARQGVLHDGVNFIQKPFTRNELGAKVREILNSPS